MCGIKRFSVLEEYNASIFSVTKLLQVDAEVIHSTKCVGYIRSLWRVWLITAAEVMNCHLMNNCCANPGKL
jgi:hypothetical protein